MPTDRSGARNRRGVFAAGQARGPGSKARPDTDKKRFAEEYGIEVRQPSSLRSEAECARLESLSPEVVVVAAYGLFLPPEALEIPPLGCLNIHPSLLPRYRGPSPVVSAIINGDDETGVTVMKLDEGMDSGPLLAQARVPIAERETGPDLTRRLFDLGGSLLAKTLPGWASGSIRATPQDESQATFTTLVKKEDGEIDWTDDAERIARMVRAYEPWPGTFTHWDGKLLKILDAKSCGRSYFARSYRWACTTVASGLVRVTACWWSTSFRTREGVRPTRRISCGATRSLWGPILGRSPAFSVRNKWTSESGRE